MKFPSVTIIIPTYNEAAHLPSLLDSLHAQTHQPDAIIVADAHSTDATREIAKTHGALVIDGGKPGAGRNAGARAAQTELLYFLDADVILPDAEMLERTLAAFTRMHLDIATMDICPSDGVAIDRLSLHVYNRYVRKIVSWRPHAAGASILVRRRLHEALQGFDETITFAEDHDYARRAAQKGLFGMLPSACYVATSMRRSKRDGRLLMIFKWITAELHLLFLGPIRHEHFHYDLGEKEKK